MRKKCGRLEEMPREIRFRAWDKKHNKMLDWEHYPLFSDQFRLILDDPDYDIMQYTGLKDKNGKEIYEGDVFKDSDDEMVIVEYKIDVAGFDPFCDSFENCGHCGSGKCSENIEVLGNIYENPELLKEKVA